MKNILFVLIATFLLSFFTKEANSECTPDCLNSLWNGPSYIEIYIPECDEMYMVKYKWRVACDIWYDYQIIEVKLSGSTCLDDQFQGDLKAYLNAITEQFIIANPANFPPIEPNDCNTNWRVIQGSCWRSDQLTGVGIIDNKNNHDNFQHITYWDILEPCSYDNCCLEYFTVCNDSQGNRTITQTNYLPPNDPTCEDTFDNKCVPVCGSVYNR